MQPTDPRPALEPLRLLPGADLRDALQQALAARGLSAGFVVSGIGSLQQAALRLAGTTGACRLDGPLEIVSIAGSLSPDGPHLHAAVSDAAGRVTGGHVLPGCTVRTTAELLLAWLPGWRFGRAHDPATGWAELTIDRGAGP